PAYGLVPFRHFRTPPCLAVPMSSRFFFNDTATTEIYTLSLHDALPIFCMIPTAPPPPIASQRKVLSFSAMAISKISSTSLMSASDRKSTRLNSSHVKISYAVFCLKKKKKQKNGKRQKQS